MPVRDFVAGEFGKPTAFQNDANAAALGEFWLGAGKEFASMVLFTLGTGVGGGIILGGKVLEGEHSHGGEVGHMRIELPDRGRLCGCGRRGCLEAYGSATAVVARTREALATHAGPTSLRGLLTDADGGEMTSREIFVAADAGDELARKIVEETAYYLALGACQLIATVDPELICYGGGMTAAGAPFLSRIDHYVREFGLSYPRPKSRCATPRWAATRGSSGRRRGHGRWSRGRLAHYATSAETHATRSHSASDSPPPSRPGSRS